MQTSDSPPQFLEKEILLVGGGHCHSLLIRKLAMNPLPKNIRVALISESVLTPYSGMLPGFIAGNYSYEETHIDLLRLCQRAQVRFIQGKVTGLNLEQRQILYDGGHLIWDILSLNIGSRHRKEGWKKVGLAQEPQIVIVGGGLAGIEIAFAFREKYTKSADNISIHLIEKSATILSELPLKTRIKLEEILKRKNISIHTQVEIQETLHDHVILSSGARIFYTELFTLTGPNTPEWLKASGLKLSTQGFIAVNDYLQSSHPDVFAVGDIADMTKTPRPKSGVFSVRQAPILFENIARTLQQKSLTRFYPQKNFLKIINIEEKNACTIYKNFFLISPLSMKLKDFIDRKFMKKFSPFEESIQKEDRYRCLGCAAKVSGNVLHKALADTLNPAKNRQALSFDDAALFTIPPGQSLVQSIDYMPSMISDPKTFGRIVTLHSFNDILAKGATPHSAMVLSTIPFQASHLMSDDARALLAGVNEELQKLGALLLGGHTSEGEKLGCGITCQGTLYPADFIPNTLTKEHHALILTKPLGVGVLFAAYMRGKAKGIWIEQALKEMLKSHYKLPGLLKKFQANAATDISGFGLLGHLREMLERSTLKVKLDLKKIPILVGALECFQKGIKSSIADENEIYKKHIDVMYENFALGHEILFDPQTSGGILCSIPSDHAEEFVHAIKTETDLCHTTIIGRTFL